MKKLTIRKAGLDDIRYIKAIEVECGLSPWSVKSYEAEIARPDSIILSAQTSDPEIVGFITGRIVRSSDIEAEIYNIGILPRAQHQGMGTRLFSEFRRICGISGTVRIWLEVRASNSKAIAFYRSQGFDAAGIRQNFYSNPVEDAEIMCLQFRGRSNLTKL